jgi:hypothetical protein
VLKKLRKENAVPKIWQDAHELFEEVPDLVKYSEKLQPVMESALRLPSIMDLSEELTDHKKPLYTTMFVLCNGIWGALSRGNLIESDGVWVAKARMSGGDKKGKGTGKEKADATSPPSQPNVANNVADAEDAEQDDSDVEKTQPKKK